jgi:hypothetical protein
LLGISPTPFSAYPTPRYPHTKGLHNDPKHEAKLGGGVNTTAAKEHRDSDSREK